MIDSDQAGDLSILFFSQLRDAMFIPDLSDYRQESDRLQGSTGLKPAQRTILKNTRRIIPPVC